MPVVPLRSPHLQVVCSRADCHMREDLRVARREAFDLGLVLRWLGTGLLIVGLVMVLKPADSGD